MSYTQMFEPLESRLMLDAQPVGPEFRVNALTGGNQDSSSIAMDADGDFVVVWDSPQDGSSDGVYAQRYDVAGVPQGNEFRVNTYTTDVQRYAAAAMDADGDFVIAWHSLGQVGTGYGTYAQRYDAAGMPKGDEFRVTTEGVGAGSNLSLLSAAMDADGDFVIAWTDSGLDGSGSGVYARLYDSAGLPKGGQFRANTHTLDAQSFPSVAMDADGDFVVAWQSRNQDGSGDGIYAQRYNAAGEAQGGEFRVNTFTANMQSMASVAMNAVGDFVIAWRSLGQDGSEYGIYAQRYNAAGVPQGVEFDVNSFTANAQSVPAVAMNAIGDFVVAWRSFGQDGSDNGVYGQLYNAVGQPQGVEFRVNSYTTGIQTLPSAAMDTDGDFVVAWESNGQDGSGNGVYAQRYAIRPEVSESSFLFDTAPHRVQFTFDRDVSASLGTDDIVLENLTTMQTIPPSDLALSYDPLTNTATFSYTGPGSSLLPGVLPDGDYRATLLAAGINTANGGQLAQDYVFHFFFLNGDANRDRRVNLEDFNILAANFGQTGTTFSQADFTYDGITNLNDFNILAGRFGQSVSPATFGGESLRSTVQGSRMIDALRDDILA